VLLAVFLSFWTWLYTYKKSNWKFLIGLAVSAGGVILLGVGGAMRRNDTTFECQAYGHCAGGGYASFGFLLVLGIWIWAIIDVSIKSQWWYGTYADA